MKYKKIIIPLLVISGVLTLGICAVMNLYFIPNIESTTQGVRCFDMAFGYSYESAVRFLSLLSDEGRSTYLTRQLPLDFFYPVAYGLFFSLLLFLLAKKPVKLLVCPFLLVLSDYGENICIVRMLRAQALTDSLVTVASCFTVMKTVMMYVTILLILGLLTRMIIKKRKQRKALPTVQT